MRTIIVPRHVDLGFFCGCELCKVSPKRLRSAAGLKKKDLAPRFIQLKEKDKKEEEDTQHQQEARKAEPKAEPKEAEPKAEPKEAEPKAVAKKRIFVARPPFLETSLEIKLKESLLKNNLLLLVGSSNTGKTSIIKRLAYILKRDILEIDDLDYDQENSIVERNITSFPIFASNKLILMDVVDFWPQTLIGAILKNIKSTKKFNSPIIITCQDSKLATVKRITNACKKSKHATCINLYKKNHERKTDLFLSDMEIAKKVFRGEQVRTDSDFVQSIVQWNYLKTTTDLTQTEQMASLFSTIDCFNTNPSTKEFGFSCFDSLSSQYRKRPKKNFFPNFNFLQKGSAFKTKQ